MSHLVRNEAVPRPWVLLGWILMCLGGIPVGAAATAAAKGGTGAGADSQARSTAGTQNSVSAWEEPVVIPTYKVGPPDPNPMFYTQESYQGAQKRIYPYPVLDYLTRDREDRTYKALYLENEYIKLSILPELGGRIFSAVDKTNGYDFFYHQHVIKPALIGMLGAWISGGVEWCAFHHHRNTTFMPVDYALAQHPDGSKTIWIGEIERRHRMKWLIGITLHPGASYIEATVKFFNRTPVAHSMLYWANVAVHANDDYQVIFPPSVQVATYHSKIDFTHWPISRGRYRGSNYRGLDISWWKNSAASNSFFAWNLQEDFMGGYDHGKKAGVVHVANHHVVCGAKLWEWGTGSFGRMWDKTLTDEDGPYAELMVGAFSDNQPDYSWIKPYEVRMFKQHWYPIRAIGGFKNANLHGAVNLERKPGNRAALGFHTTTKHTNAKVRLEAKGDVVFERVIQIAPDRPFTDQVPIPADARETDLRASLVSADGRELIAYRPAEREPVDQLPDRVKPPPAPDEIKTIEELYLTGLRVEQIHNPRVDPLDYYKEALERDPDDSRCNTMLGASYNKRGLYDEAQQHLRKAIARISAAYTRPGNTEAYYQLGVALRGQGKDEEACESFYRATWDHAFHSAAYYQLAELSCRKGDFARALDQIDRSLATNALNTKALGIKAAILRHLGRTGAATRVASSALAMDPIDFLAMNELCGAHAAAGAASEAKQVLTELMGRMRDDVQAYLELAVDYANCGMWDEAIAVLQRPVAAKMEFAGTYPLVYYMLGYLHQEKDARDTASQYYVRASKMPADYCFPFRLETVKALEAAIQDNPSDARAWYYLGNLLFDIQPQRAMTCWEKSRALDDRFALTHRNLGWAYYRVEQDIARAIDSYEKAIACSGQDARPFFELDRLYELDNAAPERRLAMLEKHHDTVATRNQSFLREIMVLVLVGRYDEAIGHLSDSFFHVREGGGEIHDVYVDAYLLRGLEHMKAGAFAQALDHFQKASEYPENLSVGRPRNDERAPQVAYYTGTAYEANGNADKAAEFYRKAADSRETPRQPQARFYRALCLQKVGRRDSARKIFDELVQDARARLERKESSDFFAKFGGETTPEARRAAAHYALGLGLLGQGETRPAKEQFGQAVELNRSHVWAKHHLAELER